MSATSCALVRCKGFHSLRIACLLTCLTICFLDILPGLLPTQDIVHFFPLQDGRDRDLHSRSGHSTFARL